MFRRVLVANRGEIACRVIATCRRLGIHTIAIYSEADRHARHVRLADEAHAVGAAPASESYLDAGRVLAVAQQARAEAVHPGYGFLSENTEFAAACAAAGIVFIGPGPDAIRRMGLKNEAKALAEAAGVPTVPGYHGDDLSQARLLQEADRIGYPLLVKAVAGGGGKGMRVVRKPGELEEAVAAAGREAATSFKDGRILLERFIERPRHIEVQVFGDTRGSHVHLFERECSIQRRYQKIIEESPSPFLTEDDRDRITSAAVRAAAAVGYVNAGTVEFVVAPGGEFYFLEMNTRLQVEHPVTEAVTGLDLVEWQLRVAAGEPLPLEQERIARCGHAIEARLYSEDPRRGFLPSTGRIERFAFPPEDAGWRVDRGVEDGDTVTVHYDPMIAKMIASGADRAAAIDRMRQCLARTAVFGPASNLALLRRIVAHRDFAAGAMDTVYLDRHLDDLLHPRDRPSDAALLVAADYALRSLPAGAAAALSPRSPWSSGDAWRLGGLGQTTLGLAVPGFLRLRARRRGDVVEVTGEGIEARAAVVHGEHDVVGLALPDGGKELTLVAHGRRIVVTDGETHEVEWVDPWPFESAADDVDSHPASPLPGRVVEVHVAEGQAVRAGQALAVVEGMKMQHTVRAGRDGVVTRVNVAAGDLVEAEAVLCDIDTRQPPQE
jgi:3-methylcrotonyl-CoA carboxylase alpha subunit